MLIASIIAIVISFLLLGHYSQKWILTRVLYSLILIFVINLMAALVAVIYLDPSLDPTTITVSSIKLSDIVKPLLIIFVMLIAYSLYYLYKIVISPKKMPRWCWLLILLFCLVTSTFWISQTVRYINRSSFFTPYPDMNRAIYINSPSSQE